MSTSRPLPAGKASAILAAARAALRELPEMGAAVPRAPVTTTSVATPKPVTLSVSRSDPVPPGAEPTTGSISAPVPVPARRATGRNTAQQNHAFDKTNPRRAAGLKPRQMTAARLLLAGRGVAEVAAELGVHPYTVSRWKRDALFDAELRRQLDRATKTNTAQQKPTNAQPPARNEAICG